MPTQTPLSFSRTDYPAGPGPFSVAVGDLNGDDKADLAVANENSSTVSVFLGNGDGTLQAPTAYANGEIPHSVAIGDLNGDGKADLAVANKLSATVAILLGNGDGTFQDQTTYATGNQPNSVAVGDLNGDDKADLAVAGGGTVSVFLGNGDGTFQDQTPYATGDSPFSVAISDLNGDGKADLATANLSDNTVSILLANGDGTFQDQTTYAAGPGAISVAIGDLNGDGKADLAVANISSNTVSVLLGNGDGSFQDQTTYATGPSPFSVAIGDLDGDGKPDLAVTNQANATVSILSGNGDGTFQDQTTYATGNGPTSVAIGDLNGDGRPDLAVADDGNNSITVLLNSVPPIDDDTGEQQALLLTVTNTAVGAATASAVPFTIAGLDPEDTGTVTFTDANNQTVQVSVNGGQTSYQANLRTLADGRISWSLAVNTDQAGNSFTPVSDVTAVAFYAFDEASGTVAYDRQGGHNGTITGATSVQGITGNALQFGGGNVVSVPNSSAWNFGSSDFSIELWANFSSTPTSDFQPLVSHDEGGGTTNKWILNTRPGNLGFHAVNPAVGNFSFQAPFNPTPGQWYFIDLSKSGSTYQLYVNGQLIGTDTETLAFSDASAPLTIGYAEGFSFDGKLDNVGIYHTALSAAEVAQIYQAGLAGIALSDTAVTLDQDIGEQAALSLTVNGGQPIGAATAAAVPFTAVGFESDDNGSVSFSDGSHAPVVVTIANGVLAATTANLAGLNNGPITATLHLNNDAAGNSFTDVIASATLSQLDHWINSRGGNWTTASNWSNGVPTSTIDADVDASGTYTVTVSSSDSAHALIVNNAGATVTDNKGGTLTLGGGSGALTITKGTFQLNGGTLKAGSISTAPGGALLIANSQQYTGANSLGESITDNGAVTIQNSSTASMTGNISGSGALTIQNSSTGNLTGNITGSEAILVQNSSTATFGNITGSEVLTVQNSGSKVTVSGAVTGSESFVINNSAQLILAGAVNTTGSFSLANSSILEFGSSDNGNVAFGLGSSTLRIDHALTAPFTGRLSGLTSKDTIDLKDLTWVNGHMTSSFSGNASSGTVTVSNGTQSVNLKLSGNYTQSTWHLSKDSTGGTNVVDPPESSFGGVSASATPTTDTDSRSVAHNVVGGPPTRGSVGTPATVFSQIDHPADMPIASLAAFFSHTDPPANILAGTPGMGGGIADSFTALLSQYAAAGFHGESGGGGHTLITNTPMSEQVMLVQPHHA